MSMKKQHRLFLVQTLIAIGIFIIASTVVKNRFNKDPKAQSYLIFDEGVKIMAASTTALVDSLILKNDLTFDPTSGKLLDKVLNNLKYSQKSKFIIVGSSQMIAVQGQGIEGYADIVSRKLNAYVKESYQLYNLSLGGMTTPEKIIMAKKGDEIIKADRILISVTPWDCISDKIRPEVKAVENKKFQAIKESVELEKGVTKTESDEVFPLNVNSKITKSTEGLVKNSIDIYRNRSAIKRWLNNKTVNQPEGINDIVEAEEAFKSNMPDYWQTANQDLDNITAWDLVVAKEGTKSIKITNKNPQNAKWFGDDIILEKPTEMFQFEGWSRSQDASEDTKLYCLDFQVIFVDGTSQWYYKNLIFSKGTHDWEKVKTEVRFDKKVKAIKPHLLFYGGTGTVWFDGINAKPVYNGKVGENILPNSNFEVELKERQNVSYSYTDLEWKRIEKNMLSIVDFLSSQKNKDQNVLLLTPFWHTETKTAYPQKAQYDKLTETIKNYAVNKNVTFVDASHILSKSNFGIYTNGKRKDKIDVLHFNAAAHDKLAKYIIKKLKL